MLMLAALTVVGVIALMIVAVLLRGWALSILWGWFAVPIFHLPALSISQALGVALIVSFLTYQYDAASEDDAWKASTFSILSPLFVLGIGWIVKGYLP